MTITNKLILSKVCTVCKQNKELKYYNRDKSKSDGLRYNCSSCRNLGLKNKRDANPEKQRAISRTNKSRFSIAVSRSKTRKIDWGLTLDQWTFLVIGETCHYCDGPLQETGVGLDRKDNSIGYLLENVIPCCCACNRIKGQTISYTEMIAIAKLLKEMRNTST